MLGSRFFFFHYATGNFFFFVLRSSSYHFNFCFSSKFNSTIYTINCNDVINVSIIHFQGISKFFYNLKSLARLDKDEENKFFVNQLNIDVNFNLISKIFLKTKKYIVNSNL